MQHNPIHAYTQATRMNPEVEDAVLTSTPTKAASLSPTTRPNALRKSQVFQRRLKAKITESRMLELLDRQLEQDRTGQSALDSNQDGEGELVCDSTMVRLEGPATPDAFDQRVCGVLKTVRCMHRERTGVRTPAKKGNQGANS